MSLLTRYSDRIYGGITFTGNTLGLSRKSNLREPGKEHIAGAFTTTDTSKRCNTFPYGTTCSYINCSSEAVLILPSNTEVVYAELIWGGTSKTPAGDVYANLNDSIKFKPPGAVESDIFPVSETRFNEKMVSNSEIYCYTRSAIITNEVKNAGAGIYKVSGVPAFLDINDYTSSQFGCVGWTLAVVYRHLLAGQPFRSITLYVGSLAVVPNTTPAITTLTDFVTPDYDNISARLLLSAAEGDYSLSGDKVYFGTVGNSNINTPLAAVNNLSNNFFASQINDDNGSLNTTGTFGTQNHYLSGGSYVGVVAGRQGWDITNIDVSANINKNKNTATLKVSTDQDAILVNGAAIVIDTNEPKIEIKKTCSKNNVLQNEEVMYTLEVSNTGNATANTVNVTDSIPNGMSFVPSSIVVGGMPHPELDIQSPNGVPLINISPGSPATIITFKLKVNSTLGITEYKNQATTIYTYYLQPEPYTALSNFSYCYPVNPGLEVIKTVTEAAVFENEIIHYKIQVKNTGDIDLVNINVIDIIPLGINLDESSVKVDGASPVGSLDTGIKILKINKGEFIMIEFEAQALNSALAPFENTATADAYFTVNEGEMPRPIDDTSNTVSTDCIKTTLTKQADKAFAQVGDEIQYTITFTNNSSVDLYNVKISDIISPKTTLILNSIVPTPLSGETLASGVTVGTNGIVVKGSSAELVFKVTVNANETGSITNTANANFKFKDNKNIEHTGSAGPATATTTIVAAGLQITKSADKTFVTENGETIVYTLVVLNTGDIKLTDITVTDPIPVGMTYKLWSTLRNETLPYTNENPENGISIGDLNPGESYKIQFSVTVAL